MVNGSNFCQHFITVQKIDRDKEGKIVGKGIKLNSPESVDEFSVNVVLFTCLFCPKGLRRLFGLNKRRLCCGGVAHELTLISANPPDCDFAWKMCVRFDVDPMPESGSGDVRS